LRTISGRAVRVGATWLIARRPLGTYGRPCSCWVQVPYPATRWSSASAAVSTMIPIDLHCSNPAVDELMDAVDDLACGAKPAGAGGGGFIGILAKDPEAAQRIAAIIAHRPGVKTYGWSLVE
jgi:hypothetical protein